MATAIRLTVMSSWAAGEARPVDRVTAERAALAWAVCFANADIIDAIGSSGRFADRHREGRTYV
jgi:hypothetical protein